MVDHKTSTPPKGALAGVRIIDLTRLAPGPYCTMLLADHGAEVIVVGGGRAGLPVPELSRGKTFISLDLKSEKGREALRRLVATADVLIEGFRPGVAARIGAGYEELSAVNPRLVYCSMTGYGQDGPRAQEAGHDINYLAASGVLGAVGPAGDVSSPPLNLLADFGAGGLLAAFGIMTALFEARRSGRGQHVDAAMIDGCMSMMAMHFPAWKTEVMPGRGDGLIVGNAPFYRCYFCADGRQVSVGALERGFFETLWRVLDLGDAPDHMDVALWPEIERVLTRTFKSEPRAHWAELFAQTDACVAAVLDPDEVWADPHNRHRHPTSSSARVPAIPRLSRTPAMSRPLDTSDHSAEVLADLGLNEDDISAATPQDAAAIGGLSWPPVLRNAPQVKG
ncbi:CaiB/BaiF CoA-transferase family protein [Pikeienuella sp. HZG-20]|uniref:CaiB/BaiF CoA transferase family protein n=1 Tax=Paludibacillus litoralis TaxID=3133267 RepID=UPI0030EC5850